jgi:ABC-2 type transport system ATP-binding protein
MSATSALVVEGLSKRFGDRVVVDGLRFDVPMGGVTGFLGPNGSGKSTTIRMLLGLVTPTAGTAQVFGQSVAKPSAYLHRVGALIDSPALYPTLSGVDNVRVHAELAGLGSARIREVLEIVGLTGRECDRARSYSLGMKQRLALAIALLRDPPLLILDEPTNGLDPSGIVEIRALIRELGTAGHTVLVSSHVLAEMQAACDRFVVIRNGRLLFNGSSDELLAQGPSRVIVRPEHPGDIDTLRREYTTRGLALTVTGEELVVDADADRSAELNRLAFEVGVTLRELVTRHDDLEDVFLQLTNDDACRAVTTVSKVSSS